MEIKILEDPQSRIADNLTTTNPTRCLSANQGKILADKLGGADNLIQFSIVDGKLQYGYKTEATSEEGIEEASVNDISEETLNDDSTSEIPEEISEEIVPEG